MSAPIICDLCWCTVEQEFISNHLKRHRDETEAQAELAATIGMLLEIINPDPATRVAEHTGLEELATPKATQVAFAKGALLEGGESYALEGHAGGPNGTGPGASEAQVAETTAL